MNKLIFQLLLIISCICLPYKAFNETFRKNMQNMFEEYKGNPLLENPFLDLTKQAKDDADRAWVASLEPYLHKTEVVLPPTTYAAAEPAAAQIVEPAPSTQSQSPVAAGAAASTFAYPQETVLSSAGQYQYGNGKSACTFIAAEAIQAILEGVHINYDLLETILTQGITKYTEKFGFGEQHSSIADLNRALATDYPHLQNIDTLTGIFNKENRDGISPLLDHLKTEPRTSCAVFVYPPETYGICYKNGKWLWYDSHRKNLSDAGSGLHVFDTSEQLVDYISNLPTIIASDDAIIQALLRVDPAIGFQSVGGQTSRIASFKGRLKEAPWLAEGIPGLAWEAGIYTLKEEGSAAAGGY